MIPCRECAHTEHPGVYVGCFYRREPCRNCNGTRLEPDQRCPKTVAFGHLYGRNLRPPWIESTTLIYQVGDAVGVSIGGIAPTVAIRPPCFAPLHKAQPVDMVTALRQAGRIGIAMGPSYNPTHWSHYQNGGFSGDNPTSWREPEAALNMPREVSDFPKNQPTIEPVRDSQLMDLAHLLAKIRKT